MTRAYATSLKPLLPGLFAGAVLSHFMKTIIAVILAAGLLTHLALAETVNFDHAKTGQAPAGWNATQTGKGGAKWSVEKDDTAPSPPNVLKQSGQATYPVCLKEDTSIKDGFVAVKFKPVSGKEDQAGGLVWRARDTDNYYVARANALENNVTIYHTLAGKRVSFKNVNTPVASSQWHTLRVDFENDKFAVTFDGNRVIEATDGSLSEAGKVGVWTKADSVTLFDDFSYGDTSGLGLDREPPKPILPGYTADPHAMVFDDAYYVYPTSDKKEWQTTDFSCWSSKDLIHWKNEGMILDVTKDLKWAKIRAWAPAMIRRDGKYYFYFCAEQKIGVAVSDQPTGKFVDALDKPLIAPSREYPAQTIDPFALLDDDGQAYLYYGQGNLYAYKLKADMITLDGPPQRLTPPRFNEGVFVIKRRGLYYFMWSENDARDVRYQVAYGTSKSPLGPIEVPPDNVILQQRGPVVGTGHHSVVQVPGTDRWYLIYHRHAIPNGNGYTRETCLARMEFDAVGRIRKVDPLAPVFPEGSKGEPITKP